MSERYRGNITTVEQQLANWLETIETDSLVGTVHSIFDSVINVLATDQNNLLTIALDDVISSPWMMKTKDNYLFETMKSRMVLGDPVKLTEKRKIKIDQIEWDYDKATYSLTKLNKRNLTEQIQNNEFLTSVYAFIKEQGKDSGLVTAFEKYIFGKSSVNSDENRYVAFFLQAIKHIDEAIEKRDNDAVLKHSYELVGLGVGLTPSGDDFLLGCLAVWHYFESPLIECFKESDWIENVKKRSTSISAFMLENGVNGYVNQALGDLLMHHQEKSLSAYLSPFLKIGATSGTDMLIGVIFAYRQMK